MADYHIEIGRHRLSLGERVEVPRIGQPQAPAGSNWDLQPGIYSVDSFVAALDLLLEAVVHQLGDAADRDSLLDGLEASISTGGSESVLPLDVFTFTDAARVEISEQARRIGAALVARARDANKARRGRSMARPGQLDALFIRSPCEGYQWTGPVIRQLMGSHGGRNVMQLYNEWLHQFVLLRDGLLPFTNWGDVPLAIGRPGADAGMRMIEQLRERFVAKLLTQRLPHAGIVALAHGLFSATSPEGTAYGFQTGLGLALPTVLGERIEQSPRYLLTWHPARLIDAADDAVVALRARLADYLAHIATDPEATLQGPLLGAVTGQLVPHQQGATATVTLELQAASSMLSTDLGQALRGHRFMQLPAHGLPSGRRGEPARQRHSARAILEQERLVQASEGIHVVSANGDPLVALALLGKLLPENLILRTGEDWEAVLTTGKGFGGRFIIDIGPNG